MQLLTKPEQRYLNTASRVLKSKLKEIEAKPDMYADQADTEFFKERQNRLDIAEDIVGDSFNLQRARDIWAKRGIAYRIQPVLFELAVKYIRSQATETALEYASQPVCSRERRQIQAERTSIY